MNRKIYIYVFGLIIGLSFLIPLYHLKGTWFNIFFAARKSKINIYRKFYRKLSTTGFS